MNKHIDQIKNNVTYIRQLFNDSIQLKNDVVNSNQLEIIALMANQISESIMNGGKLMLFGNGGSAADAQHLAAELLVRLRPHINREGVAAIALALDSSTITACGNDIGFNSMYERMVRSLGKPGDVALGISTSGNSENVIRALSAAKEEEILSFGFLGAGGGKAISLCDLAFLVPSNDTGRIQEVHITAGHALMELVENQLLDQGHLAQYDE